MRELAHLHLSDVQAVHQHAGFMYETSSADPIDRKVREYWRTVMLVTQYELRNRILRLFPFDE